MTRSLPGVLLLSIVLSSACVEDFPERSFLVNQDGDYDGDGYTENTGDCQDQVADSYPGAVEICDGLDNDCNGAIDDNAVDATTWFADADNDSYGTDRHQRRSCVAPVGYVTNAEDCDDSNGQIHPAASEVCDGGIDNNCDGRADEDDLNVTGEPTWYLDADGDGHGSSLSTVSACTAPEGYVYAGDDCDDTMATRTPGQPEICDGIDNDCNDLVDEEDELDDELNTWYIDTDGDGYGSTDPQYTKAACMPPQGTVAQSGDCDDWNANINPGATEVCDPHDQDEDCDGYSNDDDPQGASGKVIGYTDDDGDGFGHSTNSAGSFCVYPAGVVADNTDCSDWHSYIYPGALEYCDGYDNDCDGEVDEELLITTYPDYDQDGFGDGTSASVVGCDETQPGFVEDNTDCDDFDATVYPGAPEACNGVDSDCNGDIDDNVGTTYYMDADGDGFGDASQSTTACEQPSGYVGNGSDCDDGWSHINPSAVETCVTLYDDNCDGVAQEADAVGCTTFYYDSDRDGYAEDESSAACLCQGSGLSDATEIGDCDDTDDSINPGVNEDCATSADDDCDGDTNDQAAEGCSIYYGDFDGDGYGSVNYYDCLCQETEDNVSLAGDCNNSDSNIHPGNGSCPLEGDLEVSSADLLWQDWSDIAQEQVDFDGDGFGDLAFSAYHYDHYTGGVGLAYGPVTGILTFELLDALYTGSQYDSGMGYTAAALADINGDGLSELAASSPDGVYIVSGPTDGTWEMETEWDVFINHGYQEMLTLGDISGDGFEDVAIGDYLYFGPLSGSTDWSTHDSSLDAPPQIKRAGDLNQDGYDDLLWTDWVSSGSELDVLLAYGPITDNPQSGYDLQLYTIASRVNILDTGDFDADGVDDLIFSSSSADSYAGAVYLFSGPLSTGSFDVDSANAIISGLGTEGEDDADQFGHYLVNPGDIDADGFDDLLVSASGAVQFFYGPVTGDMTYLDQAGFFSGTSQQEVAAAGDTNADGYADFFVGSYMYLGRSR